MIKKYRIKKRTDNYDLMEVNELSKNSMGGTELMMRRLYGENGVSRALLKKFQIVPSRFRTLDEEKKHHILWLHDLPSDPESAKLSDVEFRNQFDAIVCVSDWQLQQYNMIKGLPYTKSIVLQNAIEPIELVEHEESDEVRFIYHTTPHRGLEIVVPVFEALAEEYDNIRLDVYSSFAVYGWAERDSQYEHLYERCRQHPQIEYHGAQDNSVIRAALQKADIFAYPSIWPETSCLALIEAMSAGVTCVHPNYSALPETAGGLTNMYQWQENKSNHAKVMYEYLKNLLENGMRRDYYRSVVKDITDYRFSWSRRKQEWEAMLKAISLSVPS